MLSNTSPRSLFCPQARAYLGLVTSLRLLLPLPCFSFVVFGACLVKTEGRATVLFSDYFMIPVKAVVSEF